MNEKQNEQSFKIQKSKLIIRKKQSFLRREDAAEGGVGD